MKDKLGDRQRLLHIADAIAELQAYTGEADLDTFLDNSMMRFACIKQIEIIGEAANHISAETKALFSDLEWKRMVGMRNVLVHEYFGIAFKLVWQVIIDDIPALKETVIQVLENMT
jgi:uncharacterized protein with HEPN domain